MPVQVVTDASQFVPKNKCAVLFVASFHEACKPGGQMDTVFGHLADKHGNVGFFKIDAEEQSDLAEQYGVEVVPTVLYLVDGKVADKVEGAHPAKVTETLDRFVATGTSQSELTSAAATPLVKRIEDLLASSYVFLFMKGNPENPKCKFSRKMLEILAQANVKNFGTFDVLSDEAVRQGLKEYSNWPTFPQLYAGGKLIGGVDIAEELQREGELAAALTPVVQEIKIAPAPVPTKKQTLEEKLEALINQAPIMVFIKGTPEEPRCGFSAQLLKLLKDNNLQFGYFDILTDDTVRQGLKTYSDWPTYPQVYTNGKLVGGLDIIRDLSEAGELKDALAASL